MTTDQTDHRADPVQAVAEALRKSRMTWGTHSDRWADAEWQDEFWTEVAEIAVAAARPLIAAEAALTEAVSLTEALRGWADDDAAAGQAKSAHALRFAASMIEANALPVLRVRADELEAGR